MIFLSKLENTELCRTMCYPNDSRRLNRDIAIIIPTDDKEVFNTVLSRLVHNKGSFRVKGISTVLLPRLKTVKSGNKRFIYRNKDYRDDKTDLQTTGIRSVVFSPVVVKNYNVAVNYVEIIQEMFSPKIKYLANNVMSIWRNIVDVNDLDHEHKYLLFTKEIIKKNITVRSAVKTHYWRIRDVYISFLYNLIFNYEEFTSLLKSQKCGVIFTDYRLTFKIDFNDENFNTQFPTKDDLFKQIFVNLKKMKLGVMIEDDVVDLEETPIVVVNDKNEAVEDSIDSSLTSTMKIVSKMKDLDNKKKDTVNEQLEEISDNLANTIGGTEVKTKLEQATHDSAKKITDIIGKSMRKDIRVPERLNTVEKKQNETINNNLVEMMAKLETIADSLIVPDVINPEKKIFGTFNINKMDEQYEGIAKKDRLEIAESFNHASIPLFLTKYKEEKNMVTKDTLTRTVQMSFESPHTSNERHTFSLNVPELREGKFLHINGSDKVMIRQKMALPIVKLENDVIFTSYYNKIFIRTTTANLSKGVSKIKKYLKYVRKKHNATYLKKYFNFIPAHHKAKYENILGPEALEVSRYISELKINNENWLNLSSGDVIAKINNVDLKCSKHSDLLVNEEMQLEYSILDVFNLLMKYMDREKDLTEVWDKVYRTKASDNISYSTTKIIKTTLPLVIVILKALDENLLELLNILQKDYGLVYEITPFKNDKPVKKIYSDDEGSTIVLKGFSIHIKYNSISNRQLLHPLTTMDLTSFNSLHMVGIVRDNVHSSATILEMEVLQDIFIDPITKQVMDDCGIPTNYAEALIYANSLLQNYDREVSEISLVNERMPANSEIIQGIMYKVIADEFAQYSKKKKRGSRLAQLSVEKDSIIKILSTMPNVEESNKLNSIQHLDKSLTISNKGISGINNDRSYTIKKRKWDKSFYGIMSDVSPYGPKTGVTKHLAVNPNITDIRGYFRSKAPKDVSPDEIMSVSEALGPFSQKHDSSPRTAMRMMQANHLMGTQGAEPALVTYGMDESMVYLDSDFAKRVKHDGEVVAINDRYIKIKYEDDEDDNNYEIVELDSIDRNASKSFFMPNRLTLTNKYKNIKIGTKVKKDSVLAYNENFYSEHGDEIIFKSGPIVNVAIMSTQYVHEDATILSNSLAKKLQARLLKRIAVKINPRNKIDIVNLNFGNISAGDTLIKFSEDTGSDFLSKIYDTDILDEHLMKITKCEYNGNYSDIHIYYKLSEDDKEDMHSSVKNLINNVNKYYKNKYDTVGLSKGLPNYEINRSIDHVTEFSDNRRNKVNGDLIEKGQILIEFFIEVQQDFSIGDKVTIGNSALKGVTSKILPDDMMPIGKDTGRKFDLIVSSNSPLARMTYSMFITGPLTASAKKINDDILQIINDHE